MNTRRTVEPSQSRTFIDGLLAEQQELTAVEKFSRKHAQYAAPLLEKYYRDLIPLTTPRPGEQYAFEVNLDTCSGCKACVTACHNLNGLDEGETWREVGVLMGGTRAQPAQLPVTTACHHCVEPGCLSGCPVEAYEKEATTGIVRHLDDQCIGCQYCTWTCPYEVPKYSAKRGIVRKCDMCHGRLADGEAPACVQACPNGAIRITVVEKHSARDRAASGIFLEDAPDPRITVPSTRYQTNRTFTEKLRAGDHGELRLQPTHWPLVFMLVLTQMSAGLYLLNTFSQWNGAFSGSGLSANERLGLAALAAGLLASVIHLGRPQHAWRAFLGWRHSWLSREVIAFGAFFSLAAVHSMIGTFYSSLATAAAGALAVVCSAMVYHATRRQFWHGRHVAIRFFGTAAVLGLAWNVCASAFRQEDTALLFSMGLMAVSAAKLAWEWVSMTSSSKTKSSELLKSAVLMRGPLRHVTGARFLCGLCGGVVLPLGFLAEPINPMIPLLALGFCVAGEIQERVLFFTAVAPAKMPGEFKVHSRTRRNL